MRTIFDIAVVASFPFGAYFVWQTSHGNRYFHVARKCAAIFLALVAMSFALRLL